MRKKETADELLGINPQHVEHVQASYLPKFLVQPNCTVLLILPTFCIVLGELSMPLWRDIVSMSSGDPLEWT